MEGRWRRGEGREERIEGGPPLPQEKRRGGGQRAEEAWVEVGGTWGKRSGRWGGRGGGEERRGRIDQRWLAQRCRQPRGSSSQPPLASSGDSWPSWQQHARG
eukprot:3163459-Rhodomonas_salina.1